MLLNNLPCTRQLPQQSSIQSKISIVPRLRNPDLGQEEGKVKYGGTEAGSWLYVGVKQMNSVSQCNRNQCHQLLRQRLGRQRVECNYNCDFFFLLSRNLKEMREMFKKIETLCKRV